MNITEYRAWLKGQEIEVDEAASQKMFDDRKTAIDAETEKGKDCLLYTSPSPRDGLLSRMPSSA